MRQNSRQTFVITTAQRGISDEQRGRRDRYILGMIIRTVCFVGAIFTAGVVQWILLAGALFLPYIAVFVANAGRERDRNPFFIQTYKNRKAIEKSSPLD